MFDKQPSEDLVFHEIEKFVRAISPGDQPYMATLNDDKGRPTGFDSDYLSGHPLVLIFVPRLDDDAVSVEILEFLQSAERLESAQAHVLLITAESDAHKNHALKEKLGLPWPVLTDPGSITFAAYGLSKQTACLRTVVLSPFRQIRAIFDAPQVKHHAAEVLGVVRTGKPASGDDWTPPHAPVLIIPNVLDARECSDLVKLFETTGDLTVTKPKGKDRDKDHKIPVYDYDRQDRIDHVIRNPQVDAFLMERMQVRVYPMISKVFYFDITRHEPFHIARYSGPRKGTAVGHRDNTAPETRYRRFALSICLNDDYEGGEIVFREYTEKGYRGNPGTAFVFSSSLLHEIMETTKGVRYNLISHFF